MIRAVLKNKGQTCRHLLAALLLASAGAALAQTEPGVMHRASELRESPTESARLARPRHRVAAATLQPARLGFDQPVRPPAQQLLDQIEAAMGNRLDAFSGQPSVPLALRLAR